MKHQLWAQAVQPSPDCSGKPYRTCNGKRDYRLLLSPNASLIQAQCPLDIAPLQKGHLAKSMTSKTTVVLIQTAASLHFRGSSAMTRFPPFRALQPRRR